MDKSKKPFVTEVLKEMENSLIKQDNNFHNNLLMAYCNNCRAISSVGGDYSVFEGRDCGGNHYKTERAPEQCTNCHTDNFIKISRYDMSKLKDVYKGKTAEIIFNGIKNGLERMYSLDPFNKELPRIISKWKRFNKQEKIKQINQLLDNQEKLSIARKKVESLEEVLIV